MRVLVDTNILLRSAQPNHALSQVAVRSVSSLLRNDAVVFFCAQNIAEFWNVATRPAGSNGLGFSQTEALREIDNIENFLKLLPDVPAIYPAWKRLVRDHSVQGVKVYDARLLAIMNVHSVDSILTFNVEDFARYENINIIRPEVQSAWRPMAMLRFNSESCPTAETFFAP